MYCFKLPCVKQYSFQKCTVLRFGSPNLLFYRCKCLAILKTVYFVGLLGKSPIDMKSAIAIGGWLAEHDVASLLWASLCKTIQFSKVYCFKIPCVKQYSFRKCTVLSFGSPNPLFYRCKCLPILKNRLLCWTVR